MNETDNPITVEAADEITAEIPRSSGLAQSTDAKPDYAPFNETPIHPALTRFREGQLFPLKGIWFKIQLIDGMGMVVLAVGLTAKEQRKIQGFKKRHERLFPAAPATSAPSTTPDVEAAA